MSMQLFKNKPVIITDATEKIVEDGKQKQKQRGNEKSKQEIRNSDESDDDGVSEDIEKDGEDINEVLQSLDTNFATFTPLLQKFSKEVIKYTKTQQEQLEHQNDAATVRPSYQNSFLNLRFQTLLSYFIRLFMDAFVKLQLSNEEASDNNGNHKGLGNSLSKEVYLQLHEVNEMLSRIRPMEKKLKYSFEKLFQLAAKPAEAKALESNAVASDKAETVRDGDEDQDESNELSQTDEFSGKGRLQSGDRPRFDSFMDFTSQSKKEKRTLKELSKLQNSGMVRILNEELDERPNEISFFKQNMSKQLLQTELEKQRFEEDNFIRLPETKKDKKKLKELLKRKSIYDDDETMDNFHDLHDFNKKSKKPKPSNPSQSEDNFEKFKRIMDQKAKFQQKQRQTRSRK